MMPRRLEEEQSFRNEEIRDATEGAFNVLARFGTSGSRGPGSPMSRWRRSAIRIASSSTSRKVREAARLKALQRTPYPLVLARIKLLLDRLAVFKEHVTQTTLSHGSLHPSRPRRRNSMARSSVSRNEAGLENGVGSRLAAAAAAAAAADPGEGGEEEQLVSSAIRSWDLRRVGGHMPSGPMDNLYGDPGHNSRRSSRVFPESRSPTGISEDEPDDGSLTGGDGGSGGARLRRSLSPTRSLIGGGGAPSAAFSTVASMLSRGGVGGGGGLGGGVGDGSGGLDPESVLGECDNIPLDDPGSGTKMSLDKLLEELSTTMSYVSDFLRKVPEETRMEACFAAKMENYKKDQTVYRIGDPPERFHLILTGVVEIWTHPPGNRREKTLIATLKKGQSFGEMAILNDEPRAEVATPTSNCTFLTFHRTDLLSCFGLFFRDRLIAAEKFFHSRVAVFQALPKKDTLKVISHMMQSTFPAGKEWEPLADQQIYFIKTGIVTLEALDRRCATTPTTSPAGGGGGAAAGLAATRGPAAAAAAGGGASAGTAAGGGGGAAASGGAGSALVSGEATSGDEMVENEILAAITIVDGRAIGTLGHEDELRRMRRAAIPKKTVATLEPGSHFGGGARVLGEGELQSCIKVTASTEITLYHMHIDQFFKCASSELVRALRDDIAFKLTYYFGRLGSIGQDMVVGHPDSSLASTRMGIVVGEDEESPLAPIRGGGGLGPRKKKGAKKGGGHSNEVDKVISHMRELEAELDNPGTKNLELYKNGTPAERYYRNPLLCGTARGNALPNIIAGLYTEGLAPLADKVDALAAKAARRLDLYHGDKPAVQRMMSIMAPASPTGTGSMAFSGGAPLRASSSSPVGRNTLVSGGFQGSSGAPGGGGTVAAATTSAAIGARPGSPIRMPSRLGGQRPPALAVDGGGAGADTGRSPGQSSGGPAAFPPTSPPLAGGGAVAVSALRARPRSSPITHSGSPSVRVSLPGEMASCGGDGEGDGGGGGDDDLQLRRSGALTAASYIWQRMRDIGGRAPPQVRQCLTYDEIAHIKAEAKRALMGGVTTMPSAATPNGTSTGCGGVRPPPANSQSGCVTSGDGGKVFFATNMASSKTMTSPFGI